MGKHLPFRLASRSTLRLVLFINCLLLAMPPFPGYLSEGSLLTQGCILMNNSQSTPRVSSASNAYCWGVIGSSPSYSAAEYSSGIRVKTLSISWRSLNPNSGFIDPTYLARKQADLSQLEQAGFSVILLLGLQDPPLWTHQQYPNSYYVDQYGDSYTGGVDGGDLNLVFNPVMRSLAAAYIQTVFADFGTHFAAVRLGGGRYGELTYPPAQYAGHSNCYWAFDVNALAASPVPAWRPGSSSPAGEAGQFLNFYLNDLVDFQNWQITTVRQHYSGPLMMLYPSWGMRPGDFMAAVNANLNGSTSAEMNGEVQRGYDFSRQVAAISDAKVIVTTTWLDANSTGDDSPDVHFWSPVKYLAYLARSNPLSLALFGENTGQGSPVAMEQSAAQMQRYGLIGMLWYNEAELFSGAFAGLSDYQQIINRYSPSQTYLPFVFRSS